MYEKLCRALLISNIPIYMNRFTIIYYVYYFFKQLVTFNRGSATSERVTQGRGERSMHLQETPAWCVKCRHTIRVSMFEKSRTIRITKVGLAISDISKMATNKRVHNTSFIKELNSWHTASVNTCRKLKCGHAVCVTCSEAHGTLKHIWWDWCELVNV